MLIYFDYTCPFAYRSHLWLEHAGVASDFDWRIFSLLEHNYRGDGPPVWELDERQDDISLLIFAGHKLVLREDGDIHQYRRNMFEAWHRTSGHLDLGEILGIVESSGVTGREADLRDVFSDAMHDHEQADRLGIFGSPTLVFDQDRVMFVKLADVPSGEAARSLLREVETIAGRVELLELKRPRPPVSPACESR